MEQPVSEAQPVQEIQPANQAQVQNPKGGNKLPLIIIILLLLAIIIGGGIFAFTQLNNQNNNKKEEDKTQEESKDDSQEEEDSNDFSKEEAKEFLNDLIIEFRVVETSIPTSSDLGTINQEATAEEIDEYLENAEEVMNEAIAAIENSRPKILALSKSNDTKRVVNAVVGIYDFLIDYYKEYILIANEYKEDEIDVEEFTKKTSDFLEEKAIEMDEIGNSFQMVREEFAKKFGIDLKDSEEEIIQEEGLTNDEMENSELDSSSNGMGEEDYEFSDEDLEQLLRELEQYQN